MTALFLKVGGGGGLSSDHTYVVMTIHKRFAGWNIADGFIAHCHSKSRP